MGGRYIGESKCFVLIGMEVFWLFSSNIGQDVKSSYRARELVSSTGVGDDSKGCGESQMDACKGMFFSLII